MIGRKYYKGSDIFLKLFRWSNVDTVRVFRREVDALLKVKGKCIAPEILDWEESSSSGFIAMERVFGRTLDKTYGTIDRGDTKIKIVMELLRLAAACYRSGIYQNDFSAHNVLVCSDGSLRLVDFEQASPDPLYDTFAFFLWMINDIYWDGIQSYKLDVYKELEITGPDVRARREFYPDLLKLNIPPQLSPLIKDAQELERWGDFVIKWDGRLL